MTPSRFHGGHAWHANKTLEANPRQRDRARHSNAAQVIIQKTSRANNRRLLCTTTVTKTTRPIDRYLEKGNTASLCDTSSRGRHAGQHAFVLNVLANVQRLFVLSLVLRCSTLPPDVRRYSNIRCLGFNRQKTRLTRTEKTREEVNASDESLIRRSNELLTRRGNSAN